MADSPGMLEKILKETTEKAVEEKARELLRDAIVGTYHGGHGRAKPRMDVMFEQLLGEIVKDEFEKRRADLEEKLRKQVQVRLKSVLERVSINISTF